MRRDDEHPGAPPRLWCGFRLGWNVQMFKHITAREIFPRKPLVKWALWSESLGSMGSRALGSGTGKPAVCQTVCATAEGKYRKGPGNSECSNPVIPPQLAVVSCIRFKEVLLRP